MCVNQNACLPEILKSFIHSARSVTAEWESESTRAIRQLSKSFQAKFSWFVPSSEVNEACRVSWDGHN